MKKVLLISLLACVCVSPVVFAQSSAAPAISETKELVRRFLEANGMRASLIVIFEDIINRAPVDSQKELRDILKPDAIIDNIVPVYTKHFTPAELTELIAFYKSPVGAKNLALTPQLMTEVMQVSQKYFETTVQKVEKSVKSK